MRKRKYEVILFCITSSIILISLMSGLIKRFQPSKDFLNSIHNGGIPEKWEEPVFQF